MRALLWLIDRSGRQNENRCSQLDASSPYQQREFLEAIAYAYHEHLRLVEFEEQFTCALSLSTKLPPIRIKPEYEIYHLLFGKGKYDVGILDDLVRLLAIPFMTLERIREILSTRNICFR